jgi:site-specific recombinase XerC
LPTPLPTVAVTLSEALAELTTAYRVAGRSPHNTALFTIYIEHLIDVIGDVELEQITTAVVTKFLDQEQQRGLKPASVSVVLRTLRRYFAWCVEQGRLASNPAKSVMAPRVVVEPVRFLDDEQLHNLLTTIGRDKTLEGVRDTALVRVLMDTGLRRGEAIGLPVRDVDLEAAIPLLTVRLNRATRQP